GRLTRSPGKITGALASSPGTGPWGELTTFGFQPGRDPERTSRQSRQRQNAGRDRFMPVRINSMTNGVRSWSLAGVKAIRIGESCGPALERSGSAREWGDRAPAPTGAGLGVFASVRLAAEVVTAAVGGRVGVTRKPSRAPEVSWPTPTIVPALFIPDAD